MDIHSANSIHFVGIKGVGMTALACCLHDLGKSLSGSDTLEPQITDPTLNQRHIPVHSFLSDNISSAVDLVIYSGAYNKSEHPELLRAVELNLPLLPQAEALSQLTKHKKVIAVCGVGGKTTTTSLIIHILETLGLKPSWSVGVSQVSGNLPPGRIGDSDIFILEADEYAIDPPQNLTPKLSLFNPHTIICTNLQFDHPDIYSSFQDTKDTFSAFFAKLSPAGHLIYNSDDQDLDQLVKTLSLSPPTISFGISTSADWHIDYQSSSKQINLHNSGNDYSLPAFLPGLHNARNATSAFIISTLFNLPPADIKSALASFTGTKRRLELISSHNNIDYYDDYAHHPSEIKATLAALKKSFPTRRLIAIFQPHTYSRTRALFDDFAQSFSAADQVIITPIFASARETKDSSVSSQLLSKKTATHHPKVEYMDSMPQVVKYLRSNQKSGDIIITLGAGDIYQLHQSLK